MIALKGGGLGRLLVPNPVDGERETQLNPQCESGERTLVTQFLAVRDLSL